jgi:hypothetical protein
MCAEGTVVSAHDADGSAMGLVSRALENPRIKPADTQGDIQGMFQFAWERRTRISVFRVLFLLHISALILILLASPVHAGDLPALQFNHGDLVTDDGNITLSWDSDPSSGGYDFVRFEQYGASAGAMEGFDGWHPSYHATGPVDLAIRHPGTYRYRVRACNELPGGQDCGPASVPVEVLVTEGVVTSRPRQLRSDLVGADEIFSSDFSASMTPSGGPTLIRPGKYESSLTNYNGWELFWVNDLRRSSLIDCDANPEGNCYSDFNQLVALWLTYRDFAGPDAPPGEENLQPVWLTGVLGPSHLPGVYTGNLVEQTRTQGVVESRVVGSLTVDASVSFSQPSITWMIPDPTYYQDGDIRAVDDTLVWDPDALFQPPEFPSPPSGPNSIDHFSGWWAENVGNADQRQFGMFSFSVGDYESNVVTFFDHQGQPIWAVSLEWGTPRTAELKDHCHYVTWDTWYPDVPHPDHLPRTEYVCQQGWSVRRGYGPVIPHPEDPGQVAIDIRVPEQVRGAPISLQFGDYEAPLPIKRLVNHHDVRHFVDGVENKDECLLDGEDGECELKLTWYSDGHYPHASVFRQHWTGSHWGQTLRVGGWNQSDRFVVEQEPHVIDEPGWYRFELRRDSSASTVLGVSRDLLVRDPDGPIPPPPCEPEPCDEGNPETPPAPEPDPNFESDEESSRIGATPAEFDVSESGAARYIIPIMTAPGSGGVEPTLSLVYDSGAGIGALGPGWSIGGTSAITRCGQTLEHQDGRSRGIKLDGKDRFCLDGQRLMLIEGEYGTPNSVYRLEIDDFSRVTALGGSDIDAGPAAFRVERKDGSVATYGAIDSSADGRNGRVTVTNDLAQRVVFAWPQTRFADSSGNYIEFEYMQPDAADLRHVEWHLERVRYTGNEYAGTEPFAEIQFQYQILPERQQRLGFTEGVRQTRTRRLQMIDSLVEGSESGSEFLRQYRLSYDDFYFSSDGAAVPDPGGMGVLQGIRECWSPAENDCLPQTVFEWNPGVAKILEEAQQSGPPIMPGDPPHIDGDLFAAFPADLNGNGRDEIVYITGREGDPLRVGALVADWKGGLKDRTAHNTTILGDDECGALTRKDELSSIQLIDIDGSGRQGLVFPLVCDENEDREGGIYFSAWEQIRPNQWRFAGPQELIAFPELDVADDKGWRDPHLKVVDWSGDGLADLVLIDAGFDWAYEKRDAIVWASENSHEQQSFSHWYEVEDVFKWVFDVPSPCQEGIEPTISLSTTPQSDPVVAVNSGGQAGVLLSQKARFYCTGIFGSDSRRVRGVRGNDGASSRGEPDKAVYRYNIFRLDISGENDDDKLQATYHAHIDAAERDVVLPSDLTGDGHTDFIILSADFHADTFDISIQLSNGRGLGLKQTEFEEIENWELMAHARVVDFFSDGRTVLLIPTEHDQGDAKWEVYQPVFRVEDADDGVQVRLGRSGESAVETGNLDAGVKNVFARIAANGWTSLVRFQEHPQQDNGGPDRQPPNPKKKWHYFRHFAQVGECGNNCSQGLQKISAITTGLGAQTWIEYGSLTDAGVHTPAVPDPELDYGQGSVVYPMVSPMYVVKAAESLAPHYRFANGAIDDDLIFQPAARTRLEYHYVGARLQGGGRGFLGFESVASYDRQSHILTITRYRQDFPFIGHPVTTESWYQPNEPWPEHDQGVGNKQLKGETLLGEAESVWVDLWSDHEQQPGVGVHHPYLLRSEERNFVPVHDGVDGSIIDAVFTHSVVTTVDDVDLFGNKGEVVTTTFDPEGNELASQITLSDYVNNESRWHLGRLSCATVTSKRASWPTPKVRSHRIRIPRRNRNAEGGTDRSFGLHLFSPSAAKVTDVRARRLWQPHHQLPFLGMAWANRARPNGSTTSMGALSTVGRCYIDGDWRTVQEVLERDRYGNATRVREWSPAGQLALFRSVGA